MYYMLDTDISSYIIRKQPLSIQQHYDNEIDMLSDDVCVSSITCSELVYGTILKPSMKAIVEKFILHINIMAWDKNAAYHYADIRNYMKKNGNIIGAHDMQIAAHARSIGAVIVTNNQKHFQNIPGLIVENWL